jgi:tetratricopeptide (TPR) repeat protein
LDRGDDDGDDSLQGGVRRGKVKKDEPAAARVMVAKPNKKKAADGEGKEGKVGGDGEGGGGGGGGGSGNGEGGEVSVIGAVNAEALSAELRIPEAERKLKAKAAPSGQICISVRLVRDDVHKAPPNWTPLEAATFYMDSGRYDKAESFLDETLVEAERAWGGEHLNTATALHNLGVLYRAQRRYRMALKVAERSCDIRRVTLRHDHPDVLAARETLGIIYLHLLQYDDAAREVRRKKERALRYDYMQK